MAEFNWVTALSGGILIGLAATLMLAGIGRIAGISGILGTLLDNPRLAGLWRWLFLAGLIGGAAIHRLVTDMPVQPREGFPVPALVIAGLLVGVGTRLGSGCTSGHGVCGLARLSPRSVTATLIFVATAMLTVWVVRHGSGGLLS